MKNRGIGTLLVLSMTLTLPLSQAGEPPAPAPRGPNWGISAGITGILLGAGALTLAIPKPSPARFQGGWLFDSTLQDRLQQPTEDLRARHSLASDVTMITNIAGPLAAYGLVALASPQERNTAQLNRALIGVQSFAANYITTWALKTAFGRERPVGIYGNDSFPSGHSSAAFTGAFLLLGPGTPFRGPEKQVWRWTLGGAGLALATATATLRMSAGRHYFTDVFTGAGLGFLFGWVYPWLIGNGEPDPRNAEPGVSLLGSDPGLSLTFRLSP